MKGIYATIEELLENVRKPQKEVLRQVTLLWKQRDVFLLRSYERAYLCILLLGSESVQ